MTRRQLFGVVLAPVIARASRSGQTYETPVQTWPESDIKILIHAARHMGWKNVSHLTQDGVTFYSFESDAFMALSSNG